MGKVAKRKRRAARLGQIGKILLAFLVILAGLPLFPGGELPKAYADTSLQIDQSSFSSVYGGQIQVNFSFDDPDLKDETQKSHDTEIALERNGSAIAT